MRPISGPWLAWKGDRLDSCHFLNDSTIAHVSFSTAECHRSDHGRMLRVVQIVLMSQLWCSPSRQFQLPAEKSIVVTARMHFAIAENKTKQVRLLKATVSGESREYQGWEGAGMRGRPSIIAISESCEIKDSVLCWAWSKTLAWLWDCCRVRFSFLVDAVECLLATVH